jgi:hypothetical protein
MKNKYKVIEILEQVTILNSDKSKTSFDTIQVTNNGIHIGRIKIKPKRDLLAMDIHRNPNAEHSCFNGYEEFEKNGSISKDKILEIKGENKRNILTKIT